MNSIINYRNTHFGIDYRLSLDCYKLVTTKNFHYVTTLYIAKFTYCKMKSIYSFSAK